MTGKLMFVPDVDTLSNIIRSIDGNHSLGAGALAEAIIAAIDTPPVLRWEEDSEREDIWELLLYGVVIATAHNNGWDAMYAGSSRIKKNPEQARRAAEKALGLPIVEEV